MENNPLVSVLMTAYNREKYISDAIESVLTSDYIKFELIIVDDASIDDTLLIAKAYESKDGRIKVYSNETNLGQFANRNMAASYAKGMYLKYLDSDDILYPFSLTIMVNGMQKYPDAALGFCLTFGPCKKPLPYILTPQESFEQHFFQGGLLFVGPSGLIFKRDSFEEVMGFEEFGMPSDNHLTLKIAARHPIVAMNRDLFWWRLHDEQVFRINEENYDNILNNYEFAKDIICKHSPLSSEQNREMLKNQKKIFFVNLIRLALKKFKPFEAFKLFRAFKANIIL